MNENLNLVEILKDCPKGIELYSPIYGFGILTKVTDRIHVKFPKEHNIKCFRPDGKVSDDGEIMLFPKGKTTWEGFQRPFVDGDIVFYNDTIAIFKEWGDETLFRTYITKYLCCDSLIDMNVPLFGKSIRKEIRLATEEEKQKLFDVIKENGYKWNDTTKTLEKLIVPKFKVGDIVRNKANGRIAGTIIALYKEVYEVKSPLGNEFSIDFISQDRFELVPNKFDPKTLQPFDKLLARHRNDNIWYADFFSNYNEVGGYAVCAGGVHYSYYIPYNEDTKHLAGKSDEAPEFYRYWEE